MKKLVSFLVVLAVLFSFAFVCLAGDTYVRGYHRKDGTYVRPHYRSAPDGNPYNNWSTKGNVNPYTGKPGYKDPSRDSYGGYGSNPYKSKGRYYK